MGFRFESETPGSIGQGNVDTGLTYIGGFVYIDTLHEDAGPLNSWNPEYVKKGSRPDLPREIRSGYIAELTGINIGDKSIVLEGMPPGQNKPIPSIEVPYENIKNVRPLEVIINEGERKFYGRFKYIP